MLTLLACAVLVRNFPQLRAVSIGNPLPCDSEVKRYLLTYLLGCACADTRSTQTVLAGFRGLTRLSELSLFHRAYPIFMSLDALIMGGRDVLRASRARDAKVLRVWSSDGLAGPCLVHEERC
jgi:hypothetical protein